MFVLSCFIHSCCSSKKDEVVKRFPGKGNIGVGAFVFLRLICPAIVAPEARG